MNTPIASNWKPVTEELPDSDLTVLVHHPEEDEPVGTGHHDGDRWRSSDLTRISVTHWMPMPEPPAAQ